MFPPDIYWSKVIGWLAAAGCALLTARAAQVFARDSPRIFTILALFSLNWALLVPYYSDPTASEILPGFSGFLLVYVGVLLRREAAMSTSNSQRGADAETDGSLASENQAP